MFKGKFIDHTQDVQWYLNALESSLQNVHQGIEHLYMDYGRYGRDAAADQQLFGYLAEYHEAWDLFADRLQSLGDTIYIGDQKSEFRGSYATTDARIYIIKHIRFLYSNLHTLADSCYQLGRVTAKGSVDEIKQASAAVAQARSEIQRLWEQMRGAALRGY